METPTGKKNLKMEELNKREEETSHGDRKQKKSPAIEETNARRNNHQLNDIKYLGIH